MTHAEIPWRRFIFYDRRYRTRFGIILGIMRRLRSLKSRRLLIYTDGQRVIVSPYPVAVKGTALAEYGRLLNATYNLEHDSLTLETDEGSITIIDSFMDRIKELAAKTADM